MSLTVQPAVIKDGYYIVWTGGAENTDQKKRNISLSTLKESGEAVNASFTPNSDVLTTVYVFNAEDTSSIGITITGEHKDSVCKKAFGITVISDVPASVYSVYYKNKKWKYKLKSLNHKAQWGLYNGGRANVTGNLNPFPIGKGMSPKSTEKECKNKAISDLTPDSSGRVARYSYWSSAITTKHELFHVVEWKTSFAPKISEAQQDIGLLSTDVTLSNLVPSSVVSSKKTDLDNIVLNRKKEAEVIWNDLGEDPAYADGKSSYEALVKLIIP